MPIAVFMEVLKWSMQVLIIIAHFSALIFCFGNFLYPCSVHNNSFEGSSFSFYISNFYINQENLAFVRIKTWQFSCFSCRWQKPGSVTLCGPFTGCWDGALWDSLNLEVRYWLREIKSSRRFWLLSYFKHKSSFSFSSRKSA